MSENRDAVEGAKAPDTLIPALTALNKMYDAALVLFKNAPRFAVAFKNGTPQRPVILIQSHGPRQDMLSAYGSTFKRRGTGDTEDGYWVVGGKRAAEIVVSAEDLAKGLDTIAAAMLRECVRHFNKLCGIKDAAKSGRLNAEFRTSGEAIGLKVEKNAEKASRGYNVVRLTPALVKEWLEPLAINDADFALFRDYAPEPAKRVKLATVVAGEMDEDTGKVDGYKLWMPPSKAVEFINAFTDVFAERGLPLGVVVGQQVMYAPLEFADGEIYPAEPDEEKEVA